MFASQCVYLTIHVSLNALPSFSALVSMPVSHSMCLTLCVTMTLFNAILELLQVVYSFGLLQIVQCSIFESYLITR